MSAAGKKRQAIYWRLIDTVFGDNPEPTGLDRVNVELCQALELPELLLDPEVGIDTVLHRYPRLKPAFDGVVPTDDEEQAPSPAESEDEHLRRQMVFAKMLLSVFGQSGRSSVISAQQYAQWTKDVGRFEEAFGYPPGGLRGKQGGGGQGAGQDAGGGGQVIGEEALQEGLKSMEAELIQRMALREVLKDRKLAQKLTPSMALVEQLLWDKNNLSGEALRNAKALIRKYIDQLSEVLKLQVAQATRGKLDYDVPPKRVFRNLDLKKTIWRNLTNYDASSGRLYVDQLYYKHTSRKTTPTRLVIVVDQSGSMVNAMVQCTILASIFAGLPNVDAHLIAFDTQVIDLTPWVSDPFEVLLRTQLGGGTYIYKALLEASTRIEEPQNTALVLISDFYEGGSYDLLFNYIRSLKESGVHFLPVGALQTSGYFSVDSWFRKKLKELGTPVLNGNIKKLIQQLKDLI